MTELTSPIYPQALIDRHTVAEHVAFADAYYEGRDGHNYLYQKPFYHPQDCAPGVASLGQLLAGLRLQTGMNVLDFAAGSCWLSRILIQLGCQVTSCDASTKALDIGRELFRQYPPIMPNPVEPVFLPFNGEHVDLPDNSVDRVVVNDAFHHVPNVHTVLQEFYRVLKPNGMVGMSEPGRHHSQTELSQFEMRTFNVIENDFVLEDIWAMAQQAGFVDIEICPVLRHPMLNMAQYQACINGQIPPVLNNALIEDTTNHSIFFLHKTAPTVKDHLSAVPDINSRGDFNSDFYLSQYPDVASALSAGQFIDAWDHYEKYGRKEGRLGRPG